MNTGLNNHVTQCTNTVYENNHNQDICVRVNMLNRNSVPHPPSSLIALRAYLSLLSFLLFTAVLPSDHKPAT